MKTCKGVPPWSPLFAGSLRLPMSGVRGGTPLQVVISPSLLADIQGLVLEGLDLIVVIFNPLLEVRAMIHFSQP